MRNAGIPAEVSNIAGTFVCNHLFYGVMHHLQGSNIKADFISIPYIPKQITNASSPSMCLDLLVKGLEAAAYAVVMVYEDIQKGAGQVC